MVISIKYSTQQSVLLTASSAEYLMELSGIDFVYNMNARNKSSEIPEQKESNIGRNFTQRYARFFIDWHFLKGHLQLTTYSVYNPRFSREYMGWYRKH